MGGGGKDEMALVENGYGKVMECSGLLTLTIVRWLVILFLSKGEFRVVSDLSLRVCVPTFLQTQKSRPIELYEEVVLMSS